MPRLNRNSPLPAAAQPRVVDSTTQRAFDLLFVPLRAVVEFLQPYVQPERWKAPSFLNNWANLGSGFHNVGFKKDPFGRVHMRGLAYKTSGIPSAGEVMFVLPVNYRPPRNTVFACPTNTGVTTLQIYASGDVRWQSGGYVNVFLDGMSFDTVNE